MNGTCEIEKDRSAPSVLGVDVAAINPGLQPIRANLRASVSF
jgi:hypothetical protein